MKKVQNQSIFNGMKEPHTIIIARGETVRYFTMKPWMAVLGGTAAVGLIASYLLATSYLVFRDDLLNGSIARQARSQQTYEDRIASLRTQLDRATSRQMLDQKMMDGKVRELIQRQKALSDQNRRLAPVLERVGAGLPVEASPPLLADSVGQDFVDSEEADGFFGIDPIITGPATSSRKPPQPRDKPTKLGIDKAEVLFDKVERSLAMLETQQTQHVMALSNIAYESADRISDALAATGVNRALYDEKSDTGGPLILANGNPVSDIDSKIADLDEAVTQLQGAKALASSVPIANPVPGMPVSSSFGTRKDPLLGLLAFHSGMDFRATSGSSVLATAKGTVTAADYNGGYGNMVDIDHGNGLSTRYGHLSQILVGVGQHVSIGDVIGKTGSTGRSTGPHLHYEIRKNGSAVNPMKYLSAGRQIAADL